MENERLKPFKTKDVVILALVCGLLAGVAGALIATWRTNRVVEKGVVKQLAELTEVSKEMTALSQAVQQQEKRLGEELVNQNVQLKAALDQQAASVRTTIQEEVGGIRGVVDDLNVLVHRAIGKELPLKIPAQTDSALVELERIVKDQDQWPSSWQEAIELQDKLNKATTGLPTWTEVHLLPRILPLRWSVEGLTRLKTPNADLGDRQALNELLDLIGARPDGVPEELVERLAAREKKMRETIRANTVAAAEKALNSDDADAVAVAVDELNYLNIEPDLRSDLSKHLSLLWQKHRVQTLKASWNAAKAVKHKRAREEALGGVYRQAISASMEFRKDGEGSRDVQELIVALEKELRDIGEEQRKAQKAIIRKYQGWALKQVTSYQEWSYKKAHDQIEKDFNRFKAPKGEFTVWKVLKEFPSVKGFMNENVKTELGVRKKEGLLPKQDQKHIYSKVWERLGWVNDVDKKLAEYVAKQAFVKYLLPIEPRLLDPAVFRIYHEAYDEGWKKLGDNSSYQLEVAKEAVKVEKIGLEDID